MVDRKWLTAQAKKVRKVDWIDPALYRKYGVKRWWAIVGYLGRIEPKTTEKNRMVGGRNRQVFGKQKTHFTSINIG